MTDRDIIRRALHDAIDWQISFAEANLRESSERKDALALVERYRKILARRYGHSRTPMESAGDGATLVSAFK